MNTDRSTHYVGQTNNYKRRLSQHRSNMRSIQVIEGQGEFPPEEWFAELAHVGALPEMTVLETIEPPAPAEFADPLVVDITWHHNNLTGEDAYFQAYVSSREMLWHWHGASRGWPLRDQVWRARSRELAERSISDFPFLTEPFQSYRWLNCATLISNCGIVISSG